jgi:hypothetical protein
MGPYGPYLPTDDTRKRAELLAWVRLRPFFRALSRPPLHTFSSPQADGYIARNSHRGPKHPLYKPPRATDATAHEWQYREHVSVSLGEQLRQSQAQLAELMNRVNASENRTSVAPSSTASIGVDAITEATSPSAVAME